MGGRRGPGRVTIADVARRAGVSAMTVSRVLNGAAAVGAETRDKVERATRELDYVPNHAARSLVVQRLGVIALVVADLGNPFFGAIARSVEGMARASGRTVIFGNTDDDVEVEAAYIRSLLSLGVDGVLLVPTGDGSADNLAQLDRLGKPVVLIDRQVRGGGHDVVLGESVRAADALTEHLIGHGHRRIAMISGPRTTTTGRDRVRGWRQAMQRHRLDADADGLRHANFSRSAGHKAACELLSARSRPTAIVAANNFLAFGAIDASRELGLSVPDDVAVVGFDDVELTPGEPTMTCANQPAEEIGRAAFELLLRRMDTPAAARRRIVLPSSLAIRHTCGC